MSDTGLFLFSDTGHYEPRVEEWLSGEPNYLYSIARQWYAVFRACGDDVTELLHDGCPTACIEGAAFGYVNVYKNYISIGFYTGAFLEDPEGLLEGSGKRMRHVKVRPDESVNEAALTALIKAAYADVKERMA